MRKDQRAAFAKRVKFASTIIGVQMACVGVGLWMQHQFLHTVSQEEVLEAAWSELSVGTKRLLGSLAERTCGAEGASAAAACFRETFSTVELEAASAFLLDSQWHVITQSPHAARLAPGTAIRWTQLKSPGTSVAGVLLGTLEAGGTTYVASVAPVPGREESVALVREAEAVKASAGAHFASLPLISGLTFVWTCALLGISAYMICSRFYDGAERAKARSVSEALRQRQDLIRTRDAIVFGLAKLADSRDRDTGDHLERISVYATALASALRNHPRWGVEITPAFIRLIGASSVLHDIGKVGVGDRILRKSGPLTPEERVAMQAHTEIGGECLRGIERRLGSSNFLQMAREIALSHHERWDGTGYPYGLRGDRIPLAARIVAIADVYDALCSRRVYKEPLSHERCVEAIRQAAGTQFDPDLVEVWLEIAPKFGEIAFRYSSAAGDADATDSTGGPSNRAAERTDDPESVVAIGSASPEGRESFQRPNAETSKR